jgi:hypothetical protein
VSKTRAIPFIGVCAGACDIPRSSKILCKRLDDNDIVLVETPTMVLYHSVSLLSFSLSLAGIIRISSIPVWLIVHVTATLDR